MCQHSGHGLWSANLQYFWPTKSPTFENFWWRHRMWFVVGAIGVAGGGGGGGPEGPAPPQLKHNQS